METLIAFLLRCVLPYLMMALVQKSYKYSHRIWEMEDIIENLTQAFISQRGESRLRGLRHQGHCRGFMLDYSLRLSLTYCRTFPLLRSGNLERTDCPIWCSPGQGSARALKLPATSAFLKPQAHFLPTLEFHTLPANSSQEGDRLVLHFHWFLCHQQRGLPWPSRARRTEEEASSSPLLKYHPPRAILPYSATPPSCLGGVS